MEFVGTVTGFISVKILSHFGFINAVNLIPDDVHAVILAFLTGAAGGLGALVIKLIWNNTVKSKAKKSE